MLLGDSQSILNRWETDFCMSPNPHIFHDVKQIEILVRIAEPPVFEPRAFDFHVATGTLKIYKFPGNDHIPEAMIQAGVLRVSFVIYIIINCMWDKK